MNILFAPVWFYGMDVVMEIIYGVIVLLLAHLVYQAYHLIKNDRLRFMFFGFVFLGIAYLFQAALNSIAIIKVFGPFSILEKLNAILVFHTYGLYVHMILFMMGLSMLFYATLRTERIRILWFLIITSLLLLVMSPERMLAFFFLSTIYLGFLFWHFLENWYRKRDKKTLLVACGFLFLVIGHIEFVFALTHPIAYVLAHIFGLVAYLLLLWNFYLVKNEKTR